MPLLPRIAVGALVVLALGLPSAALPAEPSVDALKQANNPIASFRALNFQNYYVPEVSQSDETSNTFWARYAQPVSALGGDWLARASVSLQRVPTDTETNSGLGDINAFAAYLFDTGNPAVSFGAGPLVVAPTATGGVPSPDEWQAGAATVFFDGRSDAFQYGGLVTWQTDIGGSGEDGEVNFLAVQPFGLFQLGGGLYLRSVGIWTFDLENGNYAVPVGFGIGQVFKRDGVVFNTYIEPQATILSDGPGQPEFQVLAGFNMQFAN